MIKHNIVYCNSCTTLKIGTLNLECKVCHSKMKDLGYIETVEDAIWLGQKYNNAAIDPSLEWHSQSFLNPDKEINW